MEEQFDDFKPANSQDNEMSEIKNIVEREKNELDKFKIENDEIIFANENPKSELTDMMISYIQNVGDVTDVNLSSYFSRNGEAIDAWGYSGDDEFVSIDLFLTVLVEPEKSNTLPRTEIERHFRWMEKFFKRSLSGDMLNRIDDKKSDLYQIAQLIKDCEKVDRVRMFLLTNALTPSDIELNDKETEEGTILEYHIWDVKRIKKHDDIMRGKESVIVDFEDEGFSPLPCLKMPDVSEKVECYLTIIPGVTLAKIYNQYHQHILEQNVRTFLQFKGASNKGIRDTLIGHVPTTAQKNKGDKPRDPEPDLFFSYNNGISTTATEVEIEETEAGPVITKIKDWQIVNGGQTTASISAVMKMKNITLDMMQQVFVAMKISVIKNKQMKGDLVPRISQFANTQSVIKKSDFGINESFLQEIERQSRLTWVKDTQNKETSKWFFERTRGQYMDMAKHTANAAAEKLFYAEYPKEQMFDKTTLAKVMMSWEGEPSKVCWGGEVCYTAFFKAFVEKNLPVSEEYYKKIIALLILFKTIDKYYGKDGINLVGYKANMVAYTMAMLSHITKKGLNLLKIWEEQNIISLSVYQDWGGDMPRLYAKILTSGETVDYKIKIPYTTPEGKKKSKSEVRTVPAADIEKIKGTCLYKAMQLVISLKPIIWSHIMDVDEGTNIASYTKKPIAWSNLLSKNPAKDISVPEEIITSQEETTMTPGQLKIWERANSYDYETWHDLNKWGKATQLITPKETAFMGSIYFWCKKGKDLTYKQAKYAIDILEKARVAGWDE